MWIAAQLFFTGSGITRSAKRRSSGATRGARRSVHDRLFVLNTGLIAYAVAVTSQQPLLRIWREHFVGLWLSYFAGSLVAVVLVLLVCGDSPHLGARRARAAAARAPHDVQGGLRPRGSGQPLDQVNRLPSRPSKRSLTRSTRRTR
jgi:hypothetical protein